MGRVGVEKARAVRWGEESHEGNGIIGLTSQAGRQEGMVGVAYEPAGGEWLVVCQAGHRLLRRWVRHWAVSTLSTKYFQELLEYDPYPVRYSSAGSVFGGDLCWNKLPLT
jgi:hypothetical protein